MAFMTVSAGFLLLGKGMFGEQVVVPIASVLWAPGTLGGLASTLAIPYLMFTRMEIKGDSAFAGWLMPVVPPMVSAATGALLIPYAPPGQFQLTLLLACYAMFGISLIASFLILPPAVVTPGAAQDKREQHGAHIVDRVGPVRTVGDRRESAGQ